jgi:hypothetical protein
MTSSLAFESFEMAGRCTSAAKPETVGDFLMGGCGPICADFGLDEFQDSSLGAGRFVHILLIQIVVPAVNVNFQCRCENWRFVWKCPAVSDKNSDEK